MQPAELLEKVKEDQINFFELQFTDLFGTLKAVTVPAKKLEDTLQEGKWFDGSSIQGFARIYESDMLLRPDLSTYLPLPFEEKPELKTARLMCDVHLPNGELFEGYPREVLRRTLKKAGKRGFTFNVSPELEFFLIERKDGELIPLPHDASGYFDAGTKNEASTFEKEVMHTLHSLGLEAEMSHHEVAPGQHEIGLKYGEALAIADNTLLFRQIVKHTAQKYRWEATFMPKPFEKINGSGMHTHFSLSDQEGKNLFYDSQDDYGLSTLARQFIAGILKNVREITLALNPIVNSYKRLIPGYEAPVYTCWARHNRSALIRVPASAKESSSRAEIRSPDSSCSPHLAFAVLLEAGLDGIINQLTPPEPVEENVYYYNDEIRARKRIETLPDSLKHAIKKAEEGTILREVFGKRMFEEYLRAKNREYDEYRMQVTPWERARYR